MTALPKSERPAERWARLHRRIIEAGRVPAMTLEGCEIQAKMLDSGELQPLPRPDQRLASSKEMRRVMENDAERQASYSVEHVLAREEADHFYAEDVLERAREQHRDWSDRAIAGDEAFRFRDDETEDL